MTNLEYAAFLAGGRVPNPPWWTHPDFCSPLQPVVGVSWEESSAYCAWLSESSDGLWRLPMEAEWEWAARGGLSRASTAWGETIPAGEIPEGPLRGPWEAGRGAPNSYGLLDMGTIVHEWCLDWREPARPGFPGRRASRGGSWRHAVRWSSPEASSSLPRGIATPTMASACCRPEAAGDPSLSDTDAGLRLFSLLAAPSRGRRFRGSKRGSPTSFTVA